jgi:O-antigen/teichoic acid export membrane protein
MAKNKDNFNKDVKTGMVWGVLERGGVQLCKFLASIALARLLSPSDFGVLGLSVLFTGVSGSISNFSFGMAIIQRDDVRPDHFATLFVTQLVLNSSVCAGLILLAPYVGAYFNNPLVGSVLAVSALNFLIRVLGGCPSAMLRRGRGFKALSLSNVIDAFVDVCVSVAFALLGFGVWSLVYGALTGALVSNLYLVRASGWRPSLRVSKEAFRELFGFGMGVSISELLTDAADRAANFVIGKVLGTAALGYFEKGQSLMNRPVRDLGRRAQRVLFPVFARIRHESGRFRAAVRRTILTVSLVGYPLFVSLIVLAPQIVHVLFGSQWEPAVVPFQILCITGLPRLIMQVMVMVTFVTGSSRYEMKRRTVMAILTLAGSIVGVQWGLAGVAAAVTVVSMLGLVSAIWQVYHLGLLKPLTDVLKPQSIPLAGAVLMVVAERASQAWALSLGLNAFVVLIVSLSIGSVAYLATIAIMRDEDLTRLVRELMGDIAPVTTRVPMLGTLARRFR